MRRRFAVVERPLRPVEGPRARRPHRLFRRGRAWAPVTKALALFALPMPLFLSALVALVRGDLSRLAVTSGALACFWGAGVLCWQALAAEARYMLGERLDPPAAPLKLIAALIAAMGAALTAWAAGHPVPNALVFAALAAAGCMAFYGRDLRPRRISVAVVDGVDRGTVALQLRQAHGRLRGIDAAARAMAVPELTDRLGRITGIGRNILGEIERNPREASRARRFLNLYLESAERVTQEYARTHQQLRHQPLDESFRQLLVDMEHTFTEQHKRLLEQDALSLDAEIEVLNARLRREGVG